MTPLEELIADPWFPFAGDVTVKELEPPQIPEPARSGETGESCDICAAEVSAHVWTNERWRLRAFRDTPVPGMVLLVSRAHHDSYADLPDDLLAELGPLTARIERAVLSMGGVARVHVCRWGDGSAHFHQWFMPRPLGALQLRGSMLPVWMDVLPSLPDAAVDVALAQVAAAMLAGD